MRPYPPLPNAAAGLDQSKHRSVNSKPHSIGRKIDRNFTALFRMANSLGGSVGDGDEADHLVLLQCVHKAVEVRFRKLRRRDTHPV